MRQDERVFFWLAVAYRRAFKSLDAALLEHVSVTATQYGALAQVMEDGGCTTSALAAALHLEISAATRLAERLERNGFLKRRIDPADQRARRLFLTPKGRRAVERGLPVIDEVQRRVLGALGVADPEAIVRILRGLASVNED